MSKRTNSLTEIPPPKRSRRPAGFRVARPAPVSLQPSTSSTSLFVTVNQPDNQRGIFEAQSRVLTSTTSTQGSSTSPSQKSHVQLPTESNTMTEFQDIPQIQDEPIPIHEPIQQQTVSKPKQK
jgi:hypothetical protein